MPFKPCNVNVPVLVAMLMAMLWGVSIAQSPAFGASRHDGQRTGEAPPASFSDRELSAFAEAYLEVTRVRTTYGPRISMAKDGEQAALLREKRDQEVGDILEAAGITKDVYDQIFEAFSTNDRVRKRVNQFLVQ